MWIKLARAGLNRLDRATRTIRWGFKYFQYGLHRPRPCRISACAAAARRARKWAHRRTPLLESRRPQSPTALGHTLLRGSSDLPKSRIQVPRIRYSELLPSEGCLGGLSGLADGAHRAVSNDLGRGLGFVDEHNTVDDLEHGRDSHAEHDVAKDLVLGRKERKYVVQRVEHIGTVLAVAVLAVALHRTRVHATLALGEVGLVELGPHH
mmetsp:Transcript_76097/g.217264  ORF Transcript_76097/g.217264 Transcript_76097/m.217264 type:complete len:208 (-) Transcript_76097:943-1566(-)